MSVSASRTRDPEAPRQSPSRTPEASSDFQEAPAGGLRIAFFVHRFPVVSESFIVNAAAGLVRAGHQVDIYALHGDGEAHARCSDLLADYSERWRHKAFRLRERPRRRLALAPLAAARLFVRHGANAASAWRRKHFGDDGPRLIALHEASFFRGDGRYDILHAQFGTLADAVLNHRDAGFLSGRVFAHFRGYDISSHLRERGADAYQGVFARADGFLTNCEFFRDRLIELGAPQERSTIIPSAVNVELFTSRPNPWAPGQTLRLLGVGRLVEKKGFAYAIQALAMLAADGVDFECRIVGNGPLRAALEDQAAALGLAERVSFAGAAPQQEIAEALAQAHVFLAPSTTAPNGDQDASINTLKEAMAAGRPFVSTLHGGIPELVAGLDSGVLAPEANARALYQGLQAVLDRRDDWTDMGRRARAHIERTYSIDAAAALTTQAYQKALRPQL
jgi:colanic acid/amylovoran biosynthesis glycosyltransferase